MCGFLSEMSKKRGIAVIEIGNSVRGLQPTALALGTSSAADMIGLA